MGMRVDGPQGKGTPEDPKGVEQKGDLNGRKATQKNDTDTPELNLFKRAMSGIESFFGFVERKIASFTGALTDKIFSVINPNEYALEQFGKSGRHEGTLYVRNISWRQIPAGTITGSLYLQNLEHLDQLPDGLKVQGTILIQNCAKLERLPKDLEVGKKIIIYGANQNISIPSHLQEKVELR